MKTLIYADTNSHGVFHRGFNGSSLCMFATIYDKVIYCATPSSAKIIKKDLGGKFPKNVVYKKIWINEPNNRLEKLLHLLLQSISSILIVLFANRKSTIYYNYNPLITLPIINTIAKILRRKVLITCHCELEFLNDNNFYQLNNLSIKILKLFQLDNYKWADSLYFCCLGEYIKNNSKQILSRTVWNKFLYFEHTWIFDHYDVVEENAREEKVKINIGLVGTIREEKWLNALFYLRDNLPMDSFTITTVGRLFCNPELLENHKIKFIKGADKSFISIEKMKLELSKLDYIVFIYPKNSFQLTASGSIFDAINAEKYILALHNDCFDSLYKRAKFGSLFSDLDAIISYLKQAKDIEYKQLNYTMIKQNLMPQNEVDKLKEKLIEISFI